MANEKRFCPNCGQIMNMWMRNCPDCNTLVEVPESSLADVPSSRRVQPMAPPVSPRTIPMAPAPVDDFTLQEPGVSAPAAPAATAGLPKLQVFPERMRANRALADRRCTCCEQVIELGDDVWNCQSCGNTMHSACHERIGLCGNSGCESRPKAVVRTPPRPGSARPGAPAGYGAAAAPAPTGEMVPCKFCGESILKTSRKCRYCDEYQREADRTINDKSKRDAEADATFSGGDIALGVISLLVPCVGLILGVVWMSQGKPKGWKMLLFGIIGLVINGLFRALSH